MLLIWCRGLTWDLHQGPKLSKYNQETHDPEAYTLESLCKLYHGDASYVNDLECCHCVFKSYFLSEVPSVTVSGDAQAQTAESSLAKFR